MYTIANYLLDRLSEIGIKHIFGVPGDYNLELLDYVVRHNDIEWFGNANELNAAYAADGYSRINGISAFITTYGVGELSAINGVAGSFAEDIPVIKIVGVPSSCRVINGEIIHHSLGNKQFDAFKKAYENVTVHQVWLDNKKANAQIDESIRYAIYSKKPVYIMVPQDIVNLETEQIKMPLSFNISLNRDNMAEVVANIKYKIENATQAVIIAGNKINSFGLKQELEELVDKIDINVVVNPFGKGCFNEENEHFLGMYTGSSTFDNRVKEFVDNADLILMIGSRFTDLVSSNFNLGFKKENVVEICDNYVKYDNKTFTQTSMGAILKILKNSDFAYTGKRYNNPNFNIEPFFAEKHIITQNRFYDFLNNFIRKNDIIVSDIGSYMFSMQYLNLKQGCDFIFQPLWASIGFSFPAGIGAKQVDLERRVINIIGDGAFNMTFNELATAINRNVNNIVFVLNNKGYTIEKVIHGPNEIYNKIPYVDYVKLAEAFDANHNKHISFRVHNENELYETMLKVENNKDKFILIEVMLEPMDLPKQLKNTF